MTVQHNKIPWMIFGLLAFYIYLFVCFGFILVFWYSGCGLDYEKQLLDL